MVGGGVTVIARLTGHAARISDDALVVDVNGVGYLVHATTGVHEVASRAGGEPITVHVHTIVRDDAILLYGFVSELEQAVFERLLDLQGVGPKVARAVVSTFDPRDIIRAARTGDAKLMQSVPGIGPKVARRIVTELQDRLDDIADLVIADAAQSGTTTLAAQVSDADAAFMDARDALVALGLSIVEAEAALRDLPDELGADERVRRALKAVRA